MATMTVPPSTHWKKAPPTTVSRSLEGLEIGIPPGGLLNTGSAVSVNQLWLWKPLPRLPEQRNSSVYSRESIIDNYMDRDDKDDYTYSHPDPIVSDPNDAGQSFKSSAAFSQPPAGFGGQGGRGERCSLTFKAFLSEEQYGVGMHLAKANHYFREKKWEIFPELAPQPVVQTPHPPARSRKWSLPRKRHPTGPHGHARSESDGYLKPIRTYVQKTLSKKCSLREMKKNQCESGMVFNSRRRRHSTSTKSDASTSSSLIDSAELQRSLEAVRLRMQALSLETQSSDDDSLFATNPRPSRKRTSVSTNPHRRFGSKRRPRPSSKLVRQKAPGVRFVKYRRSPSPKEGRQCPSRRPPSPLPPSPSEASHPTSPRPEYVKMLQQGTNSVLSAIDGARKKIAASRAARRRAELKKHIRVVGPVEQYPDGTVNQWL